MMRLTLVTSSLADGGAERAVILLAEGFMKKGYQVSVVTVEGTENDFYQVPNGVRRLALNQGQKSPTPLHGLWNNLYRIWVLRRTISSLKPNLVISFMEQTNIVTLISLINTKYLVIVNEQNNPARATQKLWDKLRRLTYPLATRVVSTSQGVDDYFDWIPKSKRSVIYNPLAVTETEVSTTDLIKDVDPQKKWAIAMGRLTQQKGFDILLSAFQKIAPQYPDWQLLILGEGELREELENLRESLGLGDRVFFPGRINNPFPILKKSKLFVLSSRFEGFGNVLIEAMACGLPVISTNCPSGPAEIIQNGVDGILVPNEDVSALATAMQHLMSDEQTRQSLASNAPTKAKRFSLEKIIMMWEKLFDELNGKKL